MIPDELKERWAREVARQEILFLADHGGGWPSVLAGRCLNAEARRDVLRGLGFRVCERYEMPDNDDILVPWVRLTNGVAVCLQDGFVSRNRDKRGGKRRGRIPQSVLRDTSTSSG